MKYTFLQNYITKIDVRLLLTGRRINVGFCVEYILPPPKTLRKCLWIVQTHCPHHPVYFNLSIDPSRFSASSGRFNKGVPVIRSTSFDTRLLQLILLLSSRISTQPFPTHTKCNGQSRFSNSSSLPNFSSSLHWLKIEQSIQYEKISITHDLLHSATPSYLYRLLNIQSTRSKRFSSCLCLAHPKLTSRLKFFDRSFRNAAPSLWNKLPTILRSFSTEATHANPVPFQPLALFHQQFLKYLKTYLFTPSFPS